MMPDWETISRLEEISGKLDEAIFHDEGDVEDLKVDALTIETAIKAMKEPAKVVVIVRGGVAEVQASGNVRYDIIDVDNLKAEGTSCEDVDKLILDAEEWLGG